MKKLLFVFLLIVLSFSFFRCAGVQYTDKIKSVDLGSLTTNQVSVNVLAKGEAWRDSGAIVKEGFTYKITTRGRWRFAGTCGWTGGDGIGAYGVTCWDNNLKIIKGWGHSVLVAKIGTNGAPFVIGNQYELKADSDGILYYRINDGVGWCGDNDGFLTVTTKLIESDSSVAVIKHYQQKTSVPLKTNEVKVTWRSPQKARILSIGLSEYKDFSIPLLKHAVNDAKHFAYSIDSANVPKENIKILTNKKATRNDITDAILNLKMATTEPSETAIIYFSGHGAPIVKNGKIIDAVLVPYDARENSLEYTGIKLSMLREMLSDVRGNWIVILDACFSGKEGRSLMAKNVKAIVPVPKNFSVAPKPKRNTWWITATSGDNFANDFPKENSGLFTHYFLKALNGERGVDTNEDGLISLAEVFNWTKKEVQAVSAKSLGRLQVPELIGKGDTILTIPR